MGLVSIPIVYGVHRFLSDMSEAGAFSGAVACSVLAFAVYRLVLSQRENHMLFLILIATVILLRNFDTANTISPSRAASAKSIGFAAWRRRADIAGNGRLAT